MLKKFFKDNKYINIIILFIYVCILVLGLLNHEFWRDELQAWTIARDLSFVDIFKQMQWEGHPCLWHLILAIPAKLGFSPIALSVISALFMVVTAGIILYKAPFHLPVKLCIILSSPFLYFYSIESRVYSIVPFLVCMLALIYPKRMEKPLLFTLLLALITNSHVMMSCFVGIVSIFYFKDIICEKKLKSVKHLCSLGIILLGILILYLQISDSLSKNSIVSDIETGQIMYSENEVINSLQMMLHGVGEEIDSYTGIDLVSMNVLYVVSFIVVIGLIFGLIFSFKSTMMGVVPFVFIYLLHVFIWFSLPQRACMLIILIMFAAWTHYYDMKDKNKKSKVSFIVWEVILSIFCLISIPYGIESYVFDFKNPVSGAEETAKYIEENLENAVFVCPIDYVATSIAGYIDEDIFYSNIREDYFTFVNWDSYWRKDVTYNEFYQGIAEFKNKTYKDIYIIYSSYFMWSYDVYMEFLIENEMIEEIYESPEGQESESYIIYKLTDNFENVY